MCDTYKEAKLIRFPGMIARVHQPILTEVERKKRLERIQKAAAALLKSSI